jgi:3-hydroxyacyl-CoA dehydrogenase
VQYGPAYVDALVGPHTGRAMPPLATIDFVGWDVHRAIVDNLHRNTEAAREAFVLPDYMAGLIARGHLGDKTPELGGFYRSTGKGKTAERFVLDPTRGEYVPAAAIELPEVARKMKALHHVGRYREAFDVFADAQGDAAVMRRVVLGYVSYGLSLVGEVVTAAADVDRIMGHGFNWAPPGLLVDMIGARRTIRLLEAEQLQVPRVVVDAAERGTRLYREANVDEGKFFHA